MLCCAGQPSKFVVVTTGSGCGPLNVMMDGPAKVAVVCTEVDEGYEFSYTPTAPGDYYIVIKYCNVTIAGCPHKAVVTGELIILPSYASSISCSFYQLAKIDDYDF